MFQPGDSVIVKKSRSGYTGPGTVVDRAWGINYLVRVDGDHTCPLVTVKMTDMVHRDKGGTGGKNGHK